MSVRSALRRAGAAGAVGVVTVVAAVALAAPASAHVTAHAELLSMTPKDGSTFAKAPTEVVLRYSEAIQTTGSEVVVTSPSGTTVSAGEPNIVDEVVTERLTSMTEAGVYRIVARVISEDGHPVTATGTFTVTTGRPRDSCEGSTLPWLAKPASGSSGPV